MRALSSADFIIAWELGASQPWTERGLALLALGGAHDGRPEELARLTIGQRDACLLTLRERTFGPHLDCLTTCPACAELLDFRLDAAAIREQCAVTADGTLELSYEDYAARFRLPNSLDLATLAPDADSEANARALLQRCVILARRGVEQIPAEALPPEVVEAIAGRMEEADPLADLLVAVECPKCAHRGQVPLDILSFFWSEISARAARLLREVHTLATTYGWSESDILALSAVRRQAYLELVHP